MWGCKWLESGLTVRDEVRACVREGVRQEIHRLNSLPSLELPNTWVRAKVGDTTNKREDKKDPQVLERAQLRHGYILMLGVRLGFLFIPPGATNSSRYINNCTPLHK